MAIKIDPQESVDFAAMRPSVFLSREELDFIDKLDEEPITPMPLLDRLLRRESVFAE